MFILLNKRSNNGRGFRRWEESKSELEAGLLGCDYRLAEDGSDLGFRLGEEYGRISISYFLRLGAHRKFGN